jgi:hypothetical protein
MASAIRPGTSVTFKEQTSPVITINNKQYKITQIQMRKAGQTAWQKVDFSTVDLKVLAEKCQQVFENAKPTQEELTKLSFVFEKASKSGTPLTLREIKFLRNHEKEMESFKVKVTLHTQLSHPFVDRLFHPQPTKPQPKKATPAITLPLPHTPERDPPPVLLLPVT